MTSSHNILVFSYDTYLLNPKGMQALATLPYVPMESIAKWHKAGF